MKRQAIIGIGSFGHDNAAALVSADDGSVLFAIAEERLSNLKHDGHLPVGSVKSCLDFASQHGFHISDVAVNLDEFEFISGTLLRTIARICNDDETCMARFRDVFSAAFSLKSYYCPGSASASLIDSLIKNLKFNHQDAEKIKSAVKWYFNWAVRYSIAVEALINTFGFDAIKRVRHHHAHAAAAYHASGFDNAVVLVTDAQGESDTVSIFSCSSTITPVSVSNWPHSLGVFYMMATYHLGFGLGDEYKVMGMAGYGRPEYLNYFRDIFSVESDGKLIIRSSEHYDQKEVFGCPGHFSFGFSSAFTHSILPPRAPKDEIKQCHFDFAASVQRVTESVGVDLVKAAKRLTGLNRLALSGGVALNGLMNSAIERMLDRDDLFIYPASGDDGAAVGAAQYVAMTKYGARFKRQIRNCFWGGADAQVPAILHVYGLRFTEATDVNREIAFALNQGNIVARYSGRSEFGPRALGHRSILANPCLPNMKDLVNRRIKHREAFRPFAPVCPLDRANDWFEIGGPSPFMLKVYPVKKAKRKIIPAVTHIDGTARLQTVTEDDGSGLYPILIEFERLTGVPVILNTSFNVTGEAIVETVQDAVESFLHMGIDVLVVENYFVWKESDGNEFQLLSDDQYLKLRRARYEQKFSGVSKNRISLADFPEVMVS